MKCKLFAGLNLFCDVFWSVNFRNIDIVFVMYLTLIGFWLIEASSILEKVKREAIRIKRYQ